MTRPFITISTGDQTPYQFVTNVSLTPSSVPEPTSIGLLGLTLIGLGAIRRQTGRRAG